MFTFTFIHLADAFIQSDLQIRTCVTNDIYHYFLQLSNMLIVP